MKTSVSPYELRHSLAKDPASMLVIDVRRRSDFEADKRFIPGAKWEDPEQVDAWSKDLPKDRPVVVYCVRGGSVSQSVSAKLAEAQVQVQYKEQFREALGPTFACLGEFTDYAGDGAELITLHYGTHA